MKKVLRGICYGIIGLVILGTVLILICAINPKLTDKLANTFYGIKETEAAVETTSPVNDLAEYTTSEEEQPALEDEAGQEEDNMPADDNFSAVDEYVSPDEGSLDVPGGLSDKTGFAPIEGDEQEISDAEAEKLSDELGCKETGDGLEFDPLYYPYYNMLDSVGKHLYRQIYANANALNASFKPVEPVKGNSVKNVFMAVYNDHPELFWLDTSYACKCTGDGTAIELDLDFNDTISDFTSSKSQFEKAASEIIDGAGSLGSDYDKEKYVHNALIDRASYSLNAPMNQSAYSAFVNGPTVCAGYSRAMQYCMTKLGIPCYYCTGYAGQNHAWNIVKLDDGYYNVDVTWDDTNGGNYAYFNKSDNDYRSTHVRRDLSVNLPACNGQAYSNLENSDTPASNTSDTGMRSLEDIGKTKEDVIDNLQNYYADCYHQITQNGLGQYSFENLVSSEALLNEIYTKYSNKEYMQGYMNAAIDDVGAATYKMDLLVEELEGKIFRLTHQITLEN